MSIDKNKIKTQDELNEPAPIDQVEKRVNAESVCSRGATSRK